MLFKIQETQSWFTNVVKQDYHTRDSTDLQKNTNVVKQDYTDLQDYKHTWRSMSVSHWRHLWTVTDNISAALNIDNNLDKKAISLANYFALSVWAHRNGIWLSVVFIVRSSRVFEVFMLLSAPSTESNNYIIRSVIYYDVMKPIECRSRVYSGQHSHYTTKRITEPCPSLDTGCNK